MPAARFRQPLPPVYTDSKYALDFEFYLGSVDDPRAFTGGSQFEMCFVNNRDSTQGFILSSEAATLTQPATHKVGLRVPDDFWGTLAAGIYNFELRLLGDAGADEALVVGAVPVLIGLSHGGALVQNESADFAVVQIGVSPAGAILVAGTGPMGDKGWSPVLALVADEDRTVFQVVDWVGGTGAEPSTGYVSDDGLVDAIGDAATVAAIGGWVVNAVGTAEAATVTKAGEAGIVHIIQSVELSFDNPFNGPGPLVELRDGVTVVDAFYAAYPSAVQGYSSGVTIPAGHDVSAVLAGADATVNVQISLHGVSRS